MLRSFSKPPPVKGQGMWPGPRSVVLPLPCPGADITNSCKARPSAQAFSFAKHVRPLPQDQPCSCTVTSSQTTSTLSFNSFSCSRCCDLQAASPPPRAGVSTCRIKRRPFFNFSLLTGLKEGWKKIEVYEI